MRTFKIKYPVLRWLAGFAVVLVGLYLLGVFLYYTGLLLESAHFWVYEHSLNKTLDVIFFGYLFWAALIIGASVIYGICRLSRWSGDRLFNKIAEEASRTAKAGD